MNSEKTENLIQNAILGIVGLAAGSVSFVHVHAWTVLYGQPSPVGWVNAGVTELVQIAAGVEMKRRRRAGRVGWRSFWFPVLVLAFACGTSLVAQLSQAGPGWQGKLTATLPMIGFLIVVKIIMGRSVPTPATAATTVTPHIPADEGMSLGEGLDPTPAGSASPQVAAPVIEDDPDPVRVVVPDFVPAGLTDRDPTGSTPQDPTPVPTPVRPGPTRIGDPAQASLELLDPETPIGVGTARTGPDPDPELDPHHVKIATQVWAKRVARGQTKCGRDVFAAELRDTGQWSGRNPAAGLLLKHVRERVSA